MLPVIAENLINLSRNNKKALMLVSDALLIPLAFLGALLLRFGHLSSISTTSLAFALCATICGSIWIFIKLGQYNTIIHFMGSKVIRTIATSVAYSTVLFLLCGWILLPHAVLSTTVIYGLLLFALIGGSRWAARSMYHHLRFMQHAKQPVIIYGAGEAGVQLAKNLIAGEDFFPCAFLDDNKKLHGCTINEVKVYGLDHLQQIIDLTSAKRILLAAPSATPIQRREMLNKLDGISLRIQTIPSLEDIVSGEASLEELHDIDITELLGRDTVPPQKELFTACIKNKKVLVTGAGGSIGSELCRQILTASPNTLVLYELSELALYSIEQNLQEIQKKHKTNIKIVPILGSVCNADLLNKIFSKFAIDTVYHAAAYKHVPLVEGNIFQGINNNILGTKTLAEASLKASVKNFVLISTDKAVRPTNVMGATKRSAELVLQSLANENPQTVFSMVRFGNVLGSSGSVVPLFKKQISEGGPVTVTHEDITRFFMTIPEAAQLVIQAGAMGVGGDVFVLDMGNSVKIYDMARRMILLSGKTVKDAEHPTGDIEISIVGLRPGEKLYEELLVGENVFETQHPKIMQAREEFIPLNILNEKLHNFSQLEEKQDCNGAYCLLQDIVQEFTPSSQIVDALKCD